MQRRRKQIRLAQRAYRQRKEDIISKLSQSVKFLGRTIGELHTLFFALERDISLAEDPHAKFDGYQDIIAKVTRLVKAAEHEVSNSGAEDRGYSVNTETSSDTKKSMPEGEAPQGIQTHQSVVVIPPSGSNSLPWPRQEITRRDLHDEPPGQDDNGGLLQPDHIANPTWTINGNVPQSRSREKTQELYSLESQRQRYSDECSISRELALPTSYSHSETSFARRLLRATLENSYNLMLCPRSRPEDIQRLCSFSYYQIKSARVAELYQQVINRTAKDNLEQWSVPQYHIGNAGLHYPRVGIDASSDPPSNWADAGPICARPMPNPERQVPDGVTNILEYAGVDGEWFDSNDVAEYLRTRGINVDEQSTFVDITKIDVASQQKEAPGLTDPSPLVNSSQVGWLSHDPVFTDESEPQQAATQWDPPFQNAQAMMSQGINQGFVPLNYPIDDLPTYEFSSDFDMNFGYPRLNRMKNYMDVEMFINGMFVSRKRIVSSLMSATALKKTTTCLGRTLCFRKAAVDSAISLATVIAD